MQTSVSLRIPDDAEATITVTASIADLKRLREQLYDPQAQGHWPISTFALQVREAIAKAECVFTTRKAERPGVPDEGA